MRALRTRSSCDPTTANSCEQVVLGLLPLLARGRPHEVDEPQERVLHVTTEDVEVGDQALGGDIRRVLGGRCAGRLQVRTRRCAA